MNNPLLDRVARALHEALRYSPVFDVPRTPWCQLLFVTQSEYRAVAHSALVAAGPREVWIVTDESNCSPEEQRMSSVIVVADSREAALKSLAESYGGADECVWEDCNGLGSWLRTDYGEYPWVMQRMVVQG